MKIAKFLTLPAIALAALVLALPAQAEIKNTKAASKKVDQLVNKLLAEQKIKPNKPISDEQFVRRIFLASIGRIPTGPEAAKFLESKDKNKRDKLVDELLNSEGYVSHFYNYWADILRINRRLGRSGAANEYAYKHWVKESLRSNKPYDQFVYDMVSATGSNYENGATGYYHRDRGMPLDNMANTVRIFLGTRLECAQCHDHPFDKWSQKDFFKMASFTYGVRAGYSRGGATEVRRMISNERREKIQEISEKVSGMKKFYPTRREADIDRMYEKDDRRSVARRRGIKTAEEYKAINKKVLAATAKYDRDNRTVGRVISDIYNPIRYSGMSVRDRNSKLPHDYQYDDAKPNDEIDPEPMFDSKFNKQILEEKGYLPAYATWMTSKDNPRFTQLIANRLWKKAFGVGLIEPVDQITDYSKPYNPELLKHLEESMQELDFDMKSYLAMLFKSESWQREAFAGEIAPAKPFYFPGPALQRMSAEQIWDSIVALIIPDSDHFQPTLGRELNEIDRERRINEALATHDPEDFKDMVLELTSQVKASYSKQEKIRDAYNKARQDEDEEKTRDLSRKLRDLQREMRSKIYKVAYNGADRRGGRSMQSMMADAGMSGEGERYVRTSVKRPKIEMPKDMTRDQQRNWQRQQKYYAQSWGRTASTMMRASELPTPAPRGHFLREFGQSDRELIQNANDGASVPQALNLMNGSMGDVMRHPFSVIGQALEECNSPEEEIKTIYRLMLTRQPDQSEIDRLLKVYNSEPKNARRNVIWAMLNTQQFIFSI
ncbi:MAG: DUF1549 domain-containing protein [Limisphaerales bacterium]